MSILLVSICFLLTANSAFAVTIVNVSPCAGQVDLATATSLCSGLQASLCTKADINAGAAANAKCSLSTTRVWTSTPCVNSKQPTAQAFYVLYGAGNDQGMCSLTSSNNLHDVVCCQYSTSTSGAPTTAVSPPAASPPTTASSPPTTSTGNNNLFFSPQPCSQETFSDSTTSCQAGGGRLCTRQELEGPNLNRKTVTCQNTLSNIVWSSTPCVNTKAPSSPAVYGVLGAGDNPNLPGGGVQCAVADATHTHYVMCCYDQTTSTGTPTTVASVPSASPAGGGGVSTPLPTSVPSSSGGGGTTGTPTSDFFFSAQPCIQDTYDAATAACVSGNGHVCTKTELEGPRLNRNNVACTNVLTNIVWSSTPCVNSKFPTSAAVYGVLGAGDSASLPGGGVQCAVADPTHQHFVMCCAGLAAGTSTGMPSSAPSSSTTNAPSSGTTTVTGQPTSSNTAAPTGGGASSATPSMSPATTPTVPVPSPSAPSSVPSPTNPPQSGPTTAAPTTHQQVAGSSNLSGGDIAGIVIGSLAGLALLGLLIWGCLVLAFAKKKRSAVPKEDKGVKNGIAGPATQPTGVAAAPPPNVGGGGAGSNSVLNLV